MKGDLRHWWSETTTYEIMDLLVKLFDIFLELPCFLLILPSLFIFSNTFHCSTTFNILFDSIKCTDESILFTCTP